MKYFANELGCLSQGIGNRVRSNGTIFYLRHDKIPTDKRKDVKYGQMFCNTIPQNDVPHWTSPMVGGNLIIFPGDVSTTTVDRKTASLLFNSTISTNITSRTTTEKCSQYTYIQRLLHRNILQGCVH